MPVPFTQYLLPDGRKRPIKIFRPDNIEAAAKRFIEAGGFYEVELLTTGHVSLTACMRVDDEPQDVEIVLSKNEPNVIGESVDRLVLASLKHIPGGSHDPA